jgi:hypothetical protein
MTNIFTEITRITQSIPEGTSLIRGKMVDKELNTLCPAGALLVYGIDRTNSFLEGDTNSLFTADKSTVDTLSEQTQFEADDLLAKRLDVPVWAVAGACVTTDFLLSQDSDISTRLLAVEGNDSQESTSLFSKDHEYEQAVEAIFGEAGRPISRFLKFIGSLDSFAWNSIRRRSEGEFAEAEEMAQNDVDALSAVLEQFPPRVIGAVQYWVRTLIFRRAWAVEFGGRGTVVVNSQLEWDSAWPAWGSDLGRRASIEILALSAGADIQDKALSYFGIRFTDLI